MGDSVKMERSISFFLFLWRFGKSGGGTVNQDLREKYIMKVNVSTKFIVMIVGEEQTDKIYTLYYNGEVEK